MKKRMKSTVNNGWLTNISNVGRRGLHRSPLKDHRGGKNKQKMPE